MENIFIVVIALGLTGFSLWKPDYVIGFLAGVAWLILFSYTRSNPLGGIVVGSTTDNMLSILYFGACIGIIFTTVFRVRRANKKEAMDVKEKENAEGVSRPNQQMNESDGQYMKRLNGMLRRR